MALSTSLPHVYNKQPINMAFFADLVQYFVATVIALHTFQMNKDYVTGMQLMCVVFVDVGDYIVLFLSQVC